MLTLAKPDYIDGVKDLHRKLDKFFGDAISIASKVIPLSESDMEHYDVGHTFRVYVESSSCQALSSINGYFIYGNYICRFLPVSIEPAALFPARDLSGWNDKNGRIGLKISDILKIPGRNQILRFQNKPDSRVSYPIFNVTLQAYPSPESQIVLDDIGIPYYDFSDINALKIRDSIPLNFLQSRYSMTGTNYYAPYHNFSKECYCVLFAELNNPNDQNAIKVLRWFPDKRDDAIAEITKIAIAEFALSRVRPRIKELEKELAEGGRSYRGRSYLWESLRNYRKWEAQDEETISSKKSLGDVFFELGYIDRGQNMALHRFMVNNDSRLLFGKFKDSEVKIIGGVSIFRNFDFKLPSCIAHLKIY